MKTNQLLSYRKKISIIAVMIMGLNCFAQWQTTAGPNSAGNISSLNIKNTTVFAGTATGGVFTSTNKGAAWTAKNTGITTTGDVKSIVVDGNNVFAGVSAFGSTTTVFSTNDNGDNWTGKGLSTLLLSLAGKPSYLIAGTWYGVSFSTNNGNTWTGSSTSLPSNASVTDFAFDGPNIFCGLTASSVGGTGVFLSSDNGVNWSSFNTSLTSSAIVNKLAVIGSSVFIGTAAGGVFVSGTGTPNWSSANTGLSGGSVYSLWVVDNYLFAGTNNGIFLTADHGASWTNVSLGLPSNSKIYSITSDDTDIYVGTDVKVWRRPVSELITTTGIKEKHAENTNVKIYPNPTNGMLNIRSEMENGTARALAGTMQIQMINSLGEIVLETSSATIDVTLNTNPLISGLYFLKIMRDGNVISSQKIIKQ